MCCIQQLLRQEFTCLSRLPCCTWPAAAAVFQLLLMMMRMLLLLLLRLAAGGVSWLQ
jgi:hypothetical protein